jgi:hypothetical protein
MVPHITNTLNNHWKKWIRSNVTNTNLYNIYTLSQLCVERFSMDSFLLVLGHTIWNAPNKNFKMGLKVITMYYTYIKKCNPPNKIEWNQKCSTSFDLNIY